MKNKKVLIISLVVIVVAVLVTVNLTMETSSGEKVFAEEVETRDIVEEVSASGRIQPQTKVDITSEINGEIIALPVHEGQHVKAGDLLVVLDTVQTASDVEQARYRLDEMNARLEGAKVTLEQAEDEFNRQEKLFDKNHSTETIFKNAKYAFLNSKASYEAMQAQAEQIRSAYDKQLDYFQKSKITAPMSGIITFLDVEVGEIAAAQTAFTQGKTLMTISNLEVFEVEVEVDETEINKVALGQKANIEVDAMPDTTFDGRVVEIGNTAVMAAYGSQDQSTNFKVKVTFVDANPVLRPGMSATVDITTEEELGTLTVPFSAVVVRAYDLDSLLAARAGSTAENGAVQAAEVDEDTVAREKDNDEPEELKGVFLVREGKALFAEVKTGIADHKNIQIIGGVNEGDSVIVGPYRLLRSIKDNADIEAIAKPTNEEK